MYENRQMSEKYITGIILSLVGGFLDAHTYICRGHVFANAQTGNIVLMGLKFADGNWVNAFYYLLPILSFVIGVLVAEVIKTKYKQNVLFHWRQIVILVEILVLIIVSLIPQGNLNTLANILVSFVCSLQVQSFRKVNGHAFATTMCTGNLRSATELLFCYKKEKNKSALLNSLQYYGLISFFIVGAVLGSVLTNAFSIKAISFSCIGLIAVLLLMFRKN